MLLRRASGLVYWSMLKKVHRRNPLKIILFKSSLTGNDVGALILGNASDGDVFNERFDLLRIAGSPRQPEQVGVLRKKSLRVGFGASLLNAFLNSREIVS
jgi:hypothetical protein